jgi:hypothetical protein
MSDKMRVLQGGYLNDGKIIKQGNYVVRHQDHPWPEAVDEALRVLASRGFRHCPQPVARINSCTVTLTYLPGKALGSPVPRWAANLRTLIRVSHFVSDFSVAAAGMRSRITHSDWLTRPVRGGDDLVHGDPHPTNLVFNLTRQPTGLIDFELATLGPETWNLISLIFTWAPLEPVSATCWRDTRLVPPEERIQAILRHWHTRVPARELIDACHDFIQWRKAWIRNLADLGNPGAQRFAHDQGFEGRYAHAIEVMTSAVAR